MGSNDKKGFLNSLRQWVNADQGLPTPEEIELLYGNGNDSHESHDEHGGHDGHDVHSGHDGHDVHSDHDGHDAHSDHDGHERHEIHNDHHAKKDEAAPVDPKAIEQEDMSDEGEDDELQYPDAILQKGDSTEVAPLAADEKPAAPKREKTPPKLSAEQKKRLDILKNLYSVAAVALATLIVAVLLLAISGSPAFGNPDNPSVNEVYERYVEKGTEETGATNIVAAMILDYRAFDTLGESVMLYTATMAVVMLLRETGQASSKKKEGEA